MAFISQGEIVITDANADKTIDLAENIFYYEDPTGALTFETAASEAFFRNYIQMQNNILTIGGNNNTTWVLITLKNTTKRRQDYFLSLQNPNIDELVFFSTRDSSFFNTGLNYPFSQRPSDSKFYNFVVSVIPLGVSTFCIKFSPQQHVVHIPIVMKPGSAFFDEGSFSQTMNGLVYALALLSILAIALLYISEKEKIYVVAMLLTISLLALLLYYDQTLFKYLVPNSPSANKLLGKLLKPLTLTAFIYYQKIQYAAAAVQEAARPPVEPDDYAGISVHVLISILFRQQLQKHNPQRIHRLNLHIFHLLCGIELESEKTGVRTTGRGIGHNTYLSHLQEYC